MDSGLIGSERDGGFAEYVAVPVENAHAIESYVSDAELATFPTAYVIALRMLNRSRVSAGEIATARAGVRGHINRMAAYTGKKSPSARPTIASARPRAALEKRGYWVPNIGQLGGVWATDTSYDDKIRNVFCGMSRA